MARIVSEVRPRFVFVENSPMLTTRGLGIVLGDLAEMGFNAEWAVISAADTGAPHLRERIWVVGYADNDGQIAAEIGRSIVAGSNDSQARKIETGKFERPSKQHGKMADSESEGLERQRKNSRQQEISKFRDNGLPNFNREWPAEPNVGRVANGVAARVDRLKAIGNGQVPRVAATAFELLNETEKV